MPPWHVGGQFEVGESSGEWGRNGNEPLSSSSVQRAASNLRKLPHGLARCSQKAEVQVEAVAEAEVN